jgi:hypothetical protein
LTAEAYVLAPKHRVRYSSKALIKLCPAWVSTEDAASDRDALEQICTAYASIDYATEDAANFSIVCLGVAGVSADVLKRAAAVNTAKAALREICAPLKRVNMRVPVKGDDDPPKPSP